VHRLLDVVDLPGGLWLEPAVGDGAIVRAVVQRFKERELDWATVDIREDSVAGRKCDFLTLENPWKHPHFDVVITNPPYNQALEFVKQSMLFGTTVVMLLRLNWVASQKRHAFVREHPPDVYVLPNRPSFTGKGTDSIEYAWFVWGQGGGRLRVLNLTPLEERR
jgi:hypothetical protein